MLRGEAPFASHALYTLEGVLNDDIPAERDLGMKAGLSWYKVNYFVESGYPKVDCVVYTDMGISNGMKLGIERAEELDFEIEYRTIEGWK